MSQKTKREEILEYKARIKIPCVSLGGKKGECKVCSKTIPIHECNLKSVNCTPTSKISDEEVVSCLDCNGYVASPVQVREPKAKQAKQIATVIGKPVYLKTFFDAVYLINLPKREDRLAECKIELAKGWPFDAPKRIVATDGQLESIPSHWQSGPGAWGCLRSHLRILEEAVREKKQQILILEDDFSIDEKFADRAREFLENVPTDWNGIYFGGHHHQKVWTVNDKVVKCLKTHGTYGYALKGEMIKKMLAFWGKPSIKMHLDVMIGRIMPAFNFYAPRGKWLIDHRRGKSDIWGQDKNLFDQPHTDGELFIPKKIHRIWLGGKPIPARFEKFWESWAKNHPGWELKTWTENEIGEFNCQTLLDSCRSFSEKSDVLRYQIIEKYGGVYVDTDMECFSNIENALRGWEFVACRESDAWVGSAFFAGVPGHTIYRKIINAFDFSQKEPAATGPKILTKILMAERGPTVGVLRDYMFYPVPFGQRVAGGKEKYPHSFAVHHWAHSWK